MITTVGKLSLDTRPTMQLTAFVKGLGRRGRMCIDLLLNIYGLYGKIFYSEKFKKDNSHILSSIVYLKIFILLFLSTFTFPATINLKLTTLDGATLEQAGAGTPFLLNVVVTNTSNSAQYPTLKGIDNLHVRQSGFQMNMINGATSVTYHYRVRIDTPGEYNLGPAQITEEGSIIESAPVIVTVAAQQKSNGARVQKAAATAPIMKLTCDITQVYVGQKINAELTFYTSDPTAVLQNIIEPENNAASGLVFKNKQAQPITGNEKINGTEYRFAKWNFQITPTKSGSLIIPAYGAQYSSHANQPMLSFFFRNDSKRIYSNTVALEVTQLPSSSRLPSYIGTINQMYAQVNPTHARVGEGIVYSITLAGNGDFDSLGMLALVMPENCKWYESKKNYVTNSEHFGTYTMEYIIQALEPGMLTIPKQELFYFDTVTHRYKTITTATMSITVTGNVVTESPDVPLNVNIDGACLDPLAPLNLEGPIEYIPPFFIPWYIFWPFIGIMTLLWLFIVAFTTNKDLFVKLYNKLMKTESPYSLARKAIKNAYAQKDYLRYYTIMNQLFIDRLKIAPAHLNPEVIENSLRQDGLSTPAIADWRLFYAELSEFSFYKIDLDTTYYNELTQKIVYWIDVLEKLPRVHL